MTMTTDIFQKTNGRPYPHNDEDHSPMILESRAHALRVIAWLGLTDVRIIPATDEQVAAGHLVTMQSRDYRSRRRFLRRTEAL